MTVTRDRIEVVGIDERGSLYVQPEASRFPYIYREAMEVGWDPERLCLVSPKPREWSYLDWFKQLLAAAQQQGVDLALSASTQWSNVPPDLRREIETIRAP